MKTIESYDDREALEQLAYQENCLPYVCNDIIKKKTCIFYRVCSREDSYHRTVAIVKAKRILKLQTIKEILE